MEDLAAYFSAKQRADAVDDWFNDKVALLGQEAARRRASFTVMPAINGWAEAMA